MIYEKLLQKHKYYNNAFFGKWAKLYDYEKYFLFPIRKKASLFLSTDLPAKVLDVATGTGAQAYELAKRGFEVTGIDLSPEMLKQTKKKRYSSLKLQFQQEDATKLPFKNHYFDISTISLGLHDMPYEIELLVLQEMKRVTKKDGEILIVDYMEPKKHLVARILHPLIKLYETPNYDRFIIKGLEKILSKANLKIYRFTHFLGIAQIAIAINNK